MNIQTATQDDAMAIATMHVASWRETYMGLMPQAMLDSLLVEDQAARWTRILAKADQAVFIAERDGAAIGVASSGKQRDERLRAQGFTGEISAIYVLRNEQGKGVGRRLMAAAALSLCGHGHRAASLWVLQDNQPARRFYERLGGQVCGKRDDWRESVTFIELAYGWRDLSALTARPI